MIPLWYFNLWLEINIGFGEALRAESYIGQFVRQYVSFCSSFLNPFPRNANRVLRQLFYRPHVNPQPNSKPGITLHSLTILHFKDQFRLALNVVTLNVHVQQRTQYPVKDMTTVITVVAAKFYISYIWRGIWMLTRCLHERINVHKAVKHSTG